MRPTRLKKNLAFAGWVMIAGAMIAAEVAWLHMRELLRTLGAICGSSSGVPHCAACYASAGLLAAGLSFLLLAGLLPSRTQPAPVRAD